MRLNENIKKSGYFWLVSNPDRKVPGTLSITDGGNIKLEVVGTFESEIEYFQGMMSGAAKIQNILGSIETYGLISLCDCCYANRAVSFNTNAMAISKSRLFVNRAFLGVAHNDPNNMPLKSFQFSVEGIDEWVGVSGIDVKNDLNRKKVTISYSKPDDIVVPLKNGMNLLIVFSGSYPAWSGEKEAKISQKTFFKLESDREHILSEFIEVAHKINTLICFAVNATVCIHDVTVKLNEAVQKSVELPISIYYKSSPHVEQKFIVNLDRMLFRYGQVHEQLEHIFNNWIDAYGEIEPSLNLYFSAITGAHKYLDGRFLALAQGLESYHRRTSSETFMDKVAFDELTQQIISSCPDDHKKWLKSRLRHGNEISQRSRLKIIMDSFKDFLGSTKKRNSLICKIVNTRNYLTHYDESLKSKFVSGEQLFSLCLQMEAVFQLHLLQVVGFTDGEIKSIFEENIELQRKIKGLY